MARTRERQYEMCFDVLEKHGRTALGVMSNQAWHDDPRHMLFLLARYKFVAKMLSGRKNVLEVGCADAFGTRIVQQEVKNLTAIDFDPAFIKDVQDRMEKDWTFTCKVHDILKGPVKNPGGKFDAAYAMDVLEHIPARVEDKFVGNISRSLGEHGILILGSPSIQSQQHASAQSKAGHVNCKDGKGLKEMCSRHFHHVFVFSMNDEVVHTGFYPMAHYLLALCCGKKGGLSRKKTMRV